MKIIAPIIIDDAALISSNVAETDYPAFNAATTYALGTRVIYVAANTHWVVESLQNGNIGHTPTGLATDPWWLYVSQTNKWKMFDQAINSQTSNLNTIDVTLKSLTTRVDTVSLFNVNAATARVRATDVIDGLVYDKTINLVSDSGITNWYDYFFQPIIRLADTVFSDIPPYLAASIQVTLTDTGNSPMCGACLLGLSRNIGDTQYGATTGIQDYSLKQKDAFGNASILERAFNKRATFQVWVDNSLIDELQNILAKYRAIPAIYVGSDLYKSSSIYGFYKDFSTIISYPTKSILNIEVEGLV